jgi:DNA-binding MarR family transcriptional regulator
MAVERLFKQLQDPERASDGSLSALAFALSGAASAGDIDVLEAALEQLRRLADTWRQRDDAASPGRSRQRGYLTGLMESAGWSIEHLLPDETEAALDAAASAFLEWLERHPGCSNKEIEAALGGDKAKVSRLGSDLVARGLVRRRRVGRENEWDLTAKGRRTLEGRTTSWLEATRRAVCAGLERVFAEDPAATQAVRARPGSEVQELLGDDDVLVLTRPRVSGGPVWRFAVNGGELGAVERVAPREPAEDTPVRAPMRGYTGRDFDGADAPALGRTARVDFGPIPVASTYPDKFTFIEGTLMDNSPTQEPTFAKPFGGRMVTLGTAEMKLLRYSFTPARVPALDE